MARTCYYELLGVERSADDADLKKAYRRQALVWHPDKNHGGDVDEATRVFAEIKEAYETLSDPQERAWYDNHREQILRGDDYMASAGPDDQSANVSFTPADALMRYFSLASFRGFDDSPTGFFAVYRTLFDTLRDEELQVFDPDTEDRLDLVSNLSFGTSHTLYDEDEAYAQGRRPRAADPTGATLRDFYSFWTTFSTRKSFGWFDRYRLSDAENRQVRRLMEKENKRLREKARREFVDTVQNLAAWLKKRDPRYKSYTETQRRRQHEREQDRRRRVAEQRVAALADAKAYVPQPWEEVDYTRVMEEYLDQESPSEPGDDQQTGDAGEPGGPADGTQETAADDLICAACNKEFKSAAQKANHDKSKKHQKAVREIRREMLREERLFEKAQSAQATPPSPGSILSGSDGGDSDDDPLAQMIRDLSVAQASATKKGKKKKKKSSLPQSSPGTPLPGQATEEDSPTSSQPAPGPVDSPATQRRSKKELRRERQQRQAQNALACNVCGEGFPSRNQLFAHVNELGHALASKR
ncbi:hypothetical protein GGF46_001524 [Coemansia sp. RSA 552]|nr:hypothetical protein GGF46_001524 [Coemansia sp. RSA 552]